MRPQFETQLSNRALVRAYESQRTDGSQRLIYVGKKPDSADFYTRGQAVLVRDTEALKPHLADGPADFFAMRKRDLAALPPDAGERLVKVGKFGAFQLMQERRD
jgi:hypothetical protein